MKQLLATLSIIFTSLVCFCQDWNRAMREELFEFHNNPADSIYIEDRKQLERITGHYCDDSSVTFNSTSKTDSKLEIKIENGLFEPAKHSIDLGDGVYKYVHLIDGRHCYGIDGEIPREEIKAFSVKWDGTQLSIPDTALANLYELNLCLNYIANDAVEAYLTKDNNHLYIYISGSDAAGSYGIKFVFDRKKYVARLITTNETTDHFDFLDGTVVQH